MMRATAFDGVRVAPCGGNPERLAVAVAPQDVVDGTWTRRRLRVAMGTRRAALVWPQVMVTVGDDGGERWLMGGGEMRFLAAKAPHHGGPVVTRG